MTTPKIKARSAETKALQQALQQAGFPPGLIDGEYGAATEAAVRAFQRSAGLLPDGIAGPLTLHALGLGAPAARPVASQYFTTQLVARMFPGAPLGNILANLPIVLDAMTAENLGDATMLLMALATIRAETAGFAPVTEGLSRFNTSPRGHPFDLYDNRADLGNKGAPDGASYPGRGFVQLTGRHNYEVYGKRLGLPLVKSPELANEPKVAARLLALYLADHEMRIRNAVLLNDLRYARRLVNGGSHGLEAFAEAWSLGAAVVTTVAATIN